MIRKIRKHRLYSLRAQIITIFLGATIVGLIAMLTFLSRAFEQTVFQDLEAYLLAKAHSVHVLLRENSVNSSDLASEFEWQPGSNSHMAPIALIRDRKGLTLYQTANSSDIWKVLGLDGQLKDGFLRIKVDNNQEFLILVSSVDNNSIQLALDISPQLENLSDQKWIFGLVLCFSLILLFALSVILGRTATEPIDRLVQSLKKLRPRSSLDLDPGDYPKELQPVLEALRTLHADLSNQVESLARFAANAAHELRNPLNILIGEAELMLTKPRTADEYRKTLESALEEYRELARLVDQLLFIARADRGKEPIEIVSVSIFSVAQSLVDLYEPLAQEHKIEILNRAPVGLAVCADLNLLKRALSNLLINSINYAGRGRKIWIDAKFIDSCIQVEVSDNGPGIAPEDRNLVFNSFDKGNYPRLRQYQLREKGVSPNGGSGLGLAIVKSIMDLHQGQVAIRLREGGGTVVVLSFPSKAS